MNILRLTVLAAAVFASAHLQAAPNLESIASTEYDLAVVGGTPGGIACAITAARQGLKVILTNHTGHIGGFMTSGAGGWEAPYDGARSPMFDEFRNKISDYYKTTYGENSQQHLASMPSKTSRSHLARPKVEPKVAETIFEQLIAAEKNITLLKNFYVADAVREGNLVKSIGLKEMHGTRAVTVKAKIFADCTYEADLAAAAKVPYRVGREGRDEYGEPHAGVVFMGPKKKSKDPANLNLRRLGPVEGLEMLPESTGAADKSVMAYNYRLILTKNPANRVMVEKPKNYNIDSLNKASIVPDLPNDKIAWNGGGRLVGPQDQYPEADWPTREKISRQYLDAALSRLWYAQNDPSAPQKERELWKDYGLAKDEFVDNNYEPYEIYVREARRIVGRHIFKEQDAVKADGIERTPVFTDSIAITDWPIDSAVCTPATLQNGTIFEGKFQLSDIWRPGQVPYRSLLPTGVDNLLVPVCLSATHVGWGTIRLEPVWVQTGEAAGLATAMALKEGITPAQLDPEKLVRALADSNSMISFFNDVDLASGKPWNPAVQFLGTRGFFADFEVNPDAVLATDTAKQWAGIFAKLAARDASFDPTQEARALPKNDASAPVTTQVFADQLKQALTAKNLPNTGIDAATQELKLGPTAPLTRSDACRIVYLALAK